LGIGFEQRPEAFDFGVALQDVRRVLGMDTAAAGGTGVKKPGHAGEGESKRDLSLKDGEMITINIGGKGRRAAPKVQDSSSSSAGLLAIPPHPQTRHAEQMIAMPFLPPPPSTASLKAEMKKNKSGFRQQATSSFDDNDFGEFQ